MRTMLADHPLVTHKLTLLRDAATDRATFRTLADELVTLLAYEATREIRVTEVSVTTPVGASATGEADRFYYSRPAVKKLSTRKGPELGGTTVTITGANLSGASAVKFGSSEASSFNVKSEHEIVAVSPAHAGGTVDKYIGDGAMFRFNVPHEIPDSRRQALRAAVHVARDVGEALVPHDQTR